MTSSNKLKLTNMKTMFVVSLFAVPVLCFIGMKIHSQVNVDVTLHIHRFGTADESAFRQQRTASKISSSTIHIAVVICGDRLEEGLVMLKSAVIFSHSYLVLHVFTEQELKQAVKDKFANWPYNQKSRLKLAIHNIEFPTTKGCLNCTTPGCKNCTTPGCKNCTTPGCKNCTPEAWKSLFAPCAAQGLFFPEILLDVDSLIYLDTDTVFLTSVEEAWEQFTHFGQEHVFGVVSEIGPWYSKHPLPHCTKTGVNSGVMLMNLTRVRAIKWLIKIQEYFKTYRRKILLGDQDLINIYCFFDRDLFYIMECAWNYRGAFCYKDNLCEEALGTGINILHANGRRFHDLTNWPHIGQIYRAFKEYDLSKHTPQDLYDDIVNRMKPFSNTTCGQKQHICTTNLQKYIIDSKVVKF